MRSNPVLATAITRTVARSGLLALLLGATLSVDALAQTPPEAPPPVLTENPDGTVTVSPSTVVDHPPPADPTKAQTVRLNFGSETSIMTLVNFFAQLRRMNFIIADQKSLESAKVTIISQGEVSADAAWEAFLSALQVSGYSISVTGKTAKIVKTADAGANPIRIGSGLPRESDAYVTQLIQLENTRVDDMSKIIQNMVGGEAKIVSYPPTNTMIITDSAANIRKVYQLMKELDVASPRSTMEIYTVRFATASEVKAIIAELYGTAEEDAGGAAAAALSTRASSRRSTRTSTRRPEPAVPTEPQNVGDEAKFIAKVIDDERTNSLIVLANEDGHKAVRELIAKVDVNVTPEGEIHVVYLEYAKAEEVQNVLSTLSQGGGSTSSRGSTRGGTGGRNASRTATPAPPARGATANVPGAEGGEEEGGALAAFDSGMRIAADEATNSLVIIADQDDFKVVESVIRQLDVERKQVFVDAVIMELSSEDAMSFGLAAHLPQQPTADSAGFIGAQLGATSLGLSPDALSGLAVGVFGESIDVPLIDGTVLPIPAFGIVLNALKSSGSTNIISNPSLMTQDNEEATILVGRKIPFPTTSGLNNLGQPVVSFQREDVAITLKVTPRVNSENYVTLELEVEVQEVEESAQSQASTAAGGGFITSQRKLDTVAMVGDNETMVIGGLVGTTEGKTETKVPILGDIPLLGALFRSTTSSDRKTNLMIFLTPHIVDSPDDVLEIQRVKEAQRQEFLRRFYGKSREQFWLELQALLRYSMNFVDQPTLWRGPSTVGEDLRLDDAELSPDTIKAIEEAVEESRASEPGSTAGELPADGGIDVELDDPTTDAPPLAPTDGGN